jgi:hypothetical protein
MNGNVAESVNKFEGGGVDYEDAPHVANLNPRKLLGDFK